MWPSLLRAGRAVLLVAVLALLASHWAALVLTGLGDGLPLLTLQSADRPWETWLVLPLTWACATGAARRSGTPRVVPVGSATAELDVVDSAG